MDHVGGVRLELWAQNFTLAYAWDNSSHWGCDADGTVRWMELQIPSQPCSNCTLRLLRQAIDRGYGDNFTFASCSSVDIVTSNVPCNGCNGHGSCVQVGPAAYPQINPCSPSPHHSGQPGLCLLFLKVGTHGISASAYNHAHIPASQKKACRRLVNLEVGVMPFSILIASLVVDRQASKHSNFLHQHSLSNWKLGDQCDWNQAECWHGGITSRPG